MSVWDNEKAAQLRELLPEEAGTEELVHIIGSILANYDINDMRHVSFVCVAAASSYNEFLSRYGEEEGVH